MKKQVFNPILPSWEYIPDGEPHIFGDRLYLFGSHDRFNGTTFCMNDYVCWSCPVNDLSDWHCHGIMYRKTQDPFAKPDSIMQAPDVVQGFDGRYYLYYALGLVPFVSVAVSEKPEGPYEYYGVVRRADGTPVGMGEHDVFMFDPGLFMDDDRRLYLYCGFGPEETEVFIAACKKYRLDGAYVCELGQDMLTIKTEPRRILPKVGYSVVTGFEGHEFFEASSMRKINETYYFIYSSILSHELCYATSQYPDRDFTFGGTIVSIGDVGLNGNTEPKNYLGNTHGSIVKVKDQWYVFYHRQTNKHNFSRQACAEPIAIDADGTIRQVEITSCGLNNGPLIGSGTYPANIACNLQSVNGACTYGTAETPQAAGHPYLTQTGTDRETNADQYIADIRNGAKIGFKYFRFENPVRFGVQVCGNGEGQIDVYAGAKQQHICSVDIHPSEDRVWYYADCVPLHGVCALTLVYHGCGSIDFYNFSLDKE